MTYDADYYIQKFEKIPGCFWTTNRFHFSDQGIAVCCALGHCGHRTILHNILVSAPGVKLDTEEAQALWELFRRFGFDIATVNDRKSKDFPEADPKERVLAALRWIKSREGVPA